MEEIIYASVTEIADAIRSKQVSSREVVEAYLARIDEVNPRLNAVVQLTAHMALTEARQADESLTKGEVKGPLHGVPMTLKDSIDTAGVITTGGTKGRASFVPEKDATVAARLKAAGAILVGKTNTPEMTMAGETDNLVYGRTNNPYDFSRTPGGSSGGAGAIIASGGSPFDIGSDTGGSIRGPANFCGIAGIKPNSGRVPRTGHVVPFGMGAVDSLTQLGPMARYVDDLGLILAVIAGPDWQDPAIINMPLGNPNDVDITKLRVAFHTDNGISTPYPEIMDAVSQAAKALSDAGVAVEDKRPDALEMAREMNNRLSGADGRSWVTRLLEKAGTTEIHPWIQRSIDESKVMSAQEFSAFLEEVDTFRSRMLSFMQDYDAILCPAGAYTAVPHGGTQDEVVRRGFSYTGPYNLTGWPGAVVRGSTSPEGLPIGVQVIARPWREDVALALANQLETSLGGWQKPNL